MRAIPSLRRVGADSQSAWRGYAIPALLGVFFLSVYLLTGSSDLKHNGDTYLRYQTTQALVDHHRLWIAQPEWIDTRDPLGVGNHRYAYYAPGQIMLMVPFYIAGKAIAHHLVLPYDVTTAYAARMLDLFLGALLAVLFYVAALMVGYSRRVSALLTLVFGLATVVWPDVQSGLDQTQVDLALLAAVLFDWQYVRTGMERKRWLVLCAICAGVGVLTRYDFVIYLPVLIGFPIAVRWRSRRLEDALRDVLAFGLTLLPAILAIAAWDQIRFGHIWDTGLRERSLGEPFFIGLAGLLVSPGKGVLWYVPLIFLLPVVARRFFARVPEFAVFASVLALLPILFYANFLYWHGDPAWGPRYLYTSVPYLILPLGEILTSWSRQPRATRVAFVLLTAAGLVLSVEAISVTQWRFWYRLEALEEHTSDPFLWGATHYHYYWIPAESPIFMQLDDVYQVARLQWFGNERYMLTGRPTACIPNVRCPSDPSVNYPINSFAFWWADTWHPLMGARRREALAAGLGALAVLSLMGLAVTAFPSGRKRQGGRHGERESVALGWRGS